MQIAAVSTMRNCARYFQSTLPLKYLTKPNQTNHESFIYFDVNTEKWNQYTRKILITINNNIFCKVGEEEEKLNVLKHVSRDLKASKLL